MATNKDYELVRFLLSGTDSGSIKWEPTAEPEQYTTSFKGKYTVTVNKGEDEYWLSLNDENDRQLLNTTNDEDPNVGLLYHRALRASLNVDAAIDEIIGDDIPF